MPALSAPPIGEREAAVTVQSTTSIINQIHLEEMELEKEKDMVYSHDEDILNIAAIVPPTGGMMDDCAVRGGKYIFIPLLRIHFLNVSFSFSSLLECTVVYSLSDNMLLDIVL